MTLFKDPGKRGHTVADTLLPMMFLGPRKLRNICCGHKMVLTKIRNIFCVPDTKFVSVTNVARAGKRGNICVCNNVSSLRKQPSFFAPGQKDGCFRRLQCVYNNVSSFARALMSKTMAVHVRSNSWYISLPFSAKRQREMTKFCVVCKKVNHIS